MTNNEFRIWIKGYLDLSKETHLSHQQALIICNHAQLVKTVTQHLDADIEKLVEELNLKMKQSLYFNREVLIGIIDN